MYVPGERIELSWGHPRTILSRVRLPIPPSRHRFAAALAKAGLFASLLDFLQKSICAKMLVCPNSTMMQFFGSKSIK